MKQIIKKYLKKGLKAVSHPVLVSKFVWYNLRRIIVDFLCRFGYCKYSYRIIFLAGLPLGGSTWMKNLLAGIPGFFSRPTPMPLDVAYRQDICDSAFLKFPRKYGNTLLKTHLNPSKENFQCISTNGVEKILVMYRDFRDQIVSHYYRLIAFPKPKEACDYQDYRSMDKETAINCLMDMYAQESVSWVRGWYEIAKNDPSRFYFIRFEDLKADTRKAFNNVLDFYKIQLPERKIKKIIEFSRGKSTMEKNLKAATILPSALSTNFRSGKAGAWKNEFSKNNIIKCKEILGEALIEFGYERDLTW